MKVNKQIEEMARDIASTPVGTVKPDLTLTEMGEVYKGEFICRIAKHLVKEKGYRKQEWISFEERLPDVNTDVLVCQGNYFGQLMSVYTYLGDNEWQDEYGYWCTTDSALISHWQPLPQPPKMKGAE